MVNERKSIIGLYDGLCDDVGKSSSSFSEERRERAVMKEEIFSIARAWASSSKREAIRFSSSNDSRDICGIEWGGIDRLRTDSGTPGVNGVAKRMSCLYVTVNKCLSRDDGWNIYTPWMSGTRSLRCDLPGGVTLTFNFVESTRLIGDKYSYVRSETTEMITAIPSSSSVQSITEVVTANAASDDTTVTRNTVDEHQRTEEGRAKRRRGDDEVERVKMCDLWRRGDKRKIPGEGEGERETGGLQSRKSGMDLSSNRL